MTKKIILAIILIGILTIAEGCGFTHPFVPAGGIFADATCPIAVTANSGGSKEGRATAIGVLGIVSAGDAGSKAAAMNGGITKIRTVDVESFNILGIYYSYTTIVTGE